MIEQLISIALIVGFAGYFYFYIRPRKILKWYERTLEELGYKVYVYPFCMMDSGVANQMKYDMITQGDQRYTAKHKLPSYDVVLYNTLQIPMIELINPQLIQQFLQEDKVYLYQKFPLFVENVRRSFGRGVAFSEGVHWRNKRNIMNFVFTNEFVIGCIPKMVRIVNENFEKMEKGSGIQSRIFQADVYEVLVNIYSNIMMECFLGVSLVDQKIENQSVTEFVYHLSSDINRQTYDPLGLVLGSNFLKLGLRKKDRKINRRITLLRNFCRQKINSRLAQLQKTGAKEKYTDVIQGLFLNYKIRTSQGYDMEDLVDEFCTFFTGGTESTAKFTQMMINYVALKPEVQSKLRNEVSKEIKSDEDLKVVKLQKVVYIDWIENETTRHYGPGNSLFPRKVEKDHFLKTIPMQKGVGVNICPIANHYNEKYFPNPSEFKPDRWENQCDNLPPFAFLGFSGGPRACIGEFFALLQSKITLVKFVLRYKSFKLPQTKIQMENGLMERPKKVKMELHA